MKIIHVIAGIQETCGVSQFVVNVARAQQAAGHDVTIVTTMTCGYPVEDLKVVLSEDSVAALAPRAATPTPDTVVHIHALWSRYVHRASVWCQRHGVPYVVSPHGSATPWALRYRRWRKHLAWTLYQRNDLRKAAAFHATVPDEETDIRRLGLAQRVAIAPLGATVPDQTPDAPREASVRDVVFVGRIHPVKNLPALLRAWALLASDGAVPSRRLVIAGTDDVGHQAELVALAQTLGLGTVDFSHDLEYGKKQIHGGGEVPLETFRRRLADCAADVVFTGPVYAAAKDWMFAHAWVSVLPSFSENFAGVVVEALAQGTPVIASRGTPWRELEGRCGWWVEATPETLAATLREALALDAAARERLAEKAREHVRAHYSWARSAATLVSLYASLLDQR